VVSASGPATGCSPTCAVTIFAFCYLPLCPLGLSTRDGGERIPIISFYWDRLSRDIRTSLQRSRADQVMTRADLAMATMWLRESWFLAAIVAGSGTGLGWLVATRVAPILPPFATAMIGAALAHLALLSILRRTGF
jgi:hypothetical protein